jgi:TolA-binding protein
LQKYKEAIADVQAFLKSEPKGADRSDALLVEAMANASLGNHEAAAAEFQAVLRDDPGYSGVDRVLYELAWAQLALKQEDAAAATFARLATEHPQSPLAAESLYRVGERHYQRHEYAAAAEAYARAATSSGKSELGEKAAYYLAWAQYQLGKFDESERAFESLLAAFPAGPHRDDAEFMSAECQFRQNKFEPAWAAYQKFLARPTGAANSRQFAMFHAGEAAGQLGRWQDGASVLQRALKEFPDAPNAAEVAFELAACKLKLGDETEAYQLYEQAADADREVGARARFMMGESHFGKKNFQDAIRQFMKVAYGYGYPSSSDAVKKWQADAMFEAARCFENLRKLDDAKKSYTEVLEKYPASPRAAAAKARLQELDK